MAVRYEWRVRYRRSGWLGVQSRKFDRRHDCDAFVAKLRRGDLDLEPLAELEVSQREVGKWEPSERKRK